jgi:hypothetical protein
MMVTEEGGRVTVEGEGQWRVREGGRCRPVEGEAKCVPRYIEIYQRHWAGGGGFHPSIHPFYTSAMDKTD